MCINEDFTTSLLQNMIDCLKVSHDCFVEHPETCHMKCDELFMTYELLVQHMKGVYTETGERDWDALIHSVMP